MRDIDWIKDQTVEDRIFSTFLAVALPMGW
jgi:hypothetical protein